MRHRTGVHAKASELDLEAIYVKPSLFEAAVGIFERYDDQNLSFTDATTVALVKERDIDSVLSFDDDFDGIVDRVEPGDLNR